MIIADSAWPAKAPELSKPQGALHAIISGHSYWAATIRASVLSAELICASVCSPASIHSRLSPLHNFHLRPKFHRNSNCTRWRFRRWEGSNTQWPTTDPLGLRHNWSLSTRLTIKIGTSIDVPVNSFLYRLSRKLSCLLDTPALASSLDNARPVDLRSGDLNGPPRRECKVLCHISIPITRWQVFRSTSL